MSVTTGVGVGIRRGAGVGDGVNVGSGVAVGSAVAVGAGETVGATKGMAVGSMAAVCPLATTMGVTVGRTDRWPPSSPRLSAPMMATTPARPATAAEAL